MPLNGAWRSAVDERAEGRWDRARKWFTRTMSLPQPQPPGHNVQPLSVDHLRVMGSIVTALGHLDLVADAKPACAPSPLRSPVSHPSLARLAQFFRLLLGGRAAGRTELAGPASVAQVARLNGTLSTRDITLGTIGGTSRAPIPI